MNVDLHIHTNVSDGDLEPEDIFKICKKNNIKVLSFTDHDTVANLLAGNILAKKYNIIFVNGIEISTAIGNKEIHILGYFIDYENPCFLGELKKIQKKREDRNCEIIHRLKNSNIFIDIEQIYQNYPNSTIGKYHIANYMLKQGYVSSIKEAFDRFLGVNGKACVVGNLISPYKAVKIIKLAGGIAVLAHPKFITTDDLLLHNFVRDLKNVGLDGIECQYSSFDKTEERKYKKFAKKNKLIITGGSDFHNELNPISMIGKAGLYYSQFEELLKYKMEKK